MKQAQVDKAIILCCVDAVNRKAVQMDDILELVKNEKNIFVVGTLSINYTPAQLGYVKELLQQKRIIGIKFYPGYEAFYPNDNRLDAAYALCEAYDVPAVFHSGETYGRGVGIKYSMPIHIDDLAIRRPNLKIVIAHLGNPWLDEVMVILNRHTNVYADISALVWRGFDSCWKPYYSDAIVRLIKWNDGQKHKLLFATDWPCHNDAVYYTFMKEYVRFVKQLRISKEDKELMLYKNAQKVFRT